MPCPRCRHDNPPAAKFCLECGQRLPSGCPSCGHAVAAGAKFCTECGTPLAPAAAPESYTPRHLADKILASRTAVEGERKSVTVLFCDLVGSTALAESLGDEAMHALLNRFFDAALAEVHRYEGTINQFLGDGFMALFGAPIAHEDHARRAVLAALGLRARVAGGTLGVPVELRMGLHSGLVVVGAIGDNLRMDYTAVGDTTHLAARLQHGAAPGEVIVSDATAGLVRGAVQLESLGAAAVRGLSAPVHTHRVIGLAGRGTASSTPAERPPSVFVGRARELRILDDLLHEVAQGRGQVVGVVGEPGVGKSRLVLELKRRAADAGAVGHEGRCVSFGRAIPYLPIADLVRSHCALVDADSPEQTGARVRAALHGLGLDASSDTALLLQFLGVKEGTEETAALTPEALKTRTFELLRQLILKAAARRPTMLIVEDLHWIDGSSEELLAYLADGLAAAPVMLLGTYRPGYRPGWLEKSYATQLSVSRLTPAESVSVIRTILPGVAPEDPLAALILGKAEGNPFFLEELARAVAHGGAAAGGLTVPDTVHGVLTARIDRLDDAPKRLLQTASVLGREFSVRVLEAVWDAGGVGPYLDELRRHEFIHERLDADEPVYVFKHALTQEVALSTVLAGRRRELHRRAADALAALEPERRAELAPMLAHHYFEAEAWAPAAEHAARAAETARSAGANREALERYDQAVLAAERGALAPLDRLRLHFARAQVHGVLGAFEAARADLERALALSDDAGDVRARATVLAASSALWGGHKDYVRGLALADEAVQTAARAGDHRVFADALTQRGLMQLNVARLSESRDSLEQALATFERLADERGSAQTLDVLAMVEGLQGRVAACRRRSQDALRRYRGLGDRAPEPSLITNEGFWLAYGGELATAQRLIAEGLAAAIALGARSAEAYACMATAETMDMYGRLGGAVRESARALELAVELEHAEWTVASLAIVGRLHRMCGDLPAALGAHERMLELTRGLGAVIWLADALGELGQDRLALGDEDGAMAALDEAVRTAGETVKFGMRGFVARTELALARGDAGGALASARRLLATTEEFRVFAVEAMRLEGLALMALGRADEAEAVLGRAREEARARDIRPAMWRACLALAQLAEQKGAHADSAAFRDEARAALDLASADLPDAMGAGFRQSAVYRRAMREGPP
ncbi:MAG TPA: AAA family ATPase [Terriglobales bacterium]|nr:AAA family ATPase [Terriglobales bacterium]